MSDNTKYKHIFIAYASKDEAAYKTLMSQLEVLAKEIPIETWGKAELMPGAIIEETTQAKLKSADILLLLVSAELLTNESYINLQPQLQASTQVVPVLLRPCAWESDPFLKKRQVLPKSEQFISLVDDEDEVYMEIVRDIRTMVVGKTEEKPSVPPVNQSPFWKKSVLITLIAVLALVGIWGISSLLKIEDKPTVVINEPELPTEPTTFIAEYGTPIFTPSDTFNILILRFEDYIAKEGIDCIGLAIKKRLIDIRTNKDLAIYPIYAENILSPEYVEQAIFIQEYHNADLLIHGLASEIKPKCMGANICFRHVVANAVMMNIDSSKHIQRIKHDLKRELVSPFDIEQGKLSVDEQSMEAWVTGLVALKKDDKETYFEEIEKIAMDITHLPEEEQASKFYNQGLIYLESECYEKAIASYTKAIELKPDYALFYIGRGGAYHLFKKYEKAILNFDKAIGLKQESNFYNFRGRSYFYSENYPEAISDYNKAIELNSDYADAYYNRGESYFYEKDYQKAISDFDKTIELKSDYVDSYIFRGISYGELEDHERAISNYNKAIELTSDNAAAYYNRGNSYLHLEDYKKAILNFDEAIKLEPGNADIYLNRGTTYCSTNLKDYERAILDFNKALELKPNPDIIYKIYINRGISYKNSKDYGRAILDFDRAIELEPNYARTYRSRGISYHNLKDYKRAIADYKEAIQLKPFYIKAYLNLVYSIIRSNLHIVIFIFVICIVLKVWWKNSKKPFTFIQNSK